MKLRIAIGTMQLIYPPFHDQQKSSQKSEDCRLRRYTENGATYKIDFRPLLLCTCGCLRLGPCERLKIDLFVSCHLAAGATRRHRCPIEIPSWLQTRNQSRTEISAIQIPDLLFHHCFSFWFSLTLFWNELIIIIFAANTFSYSIWRKKIKCKNNQSVYPFNAA